MVFQSIQEVVHLLSGNQGVKELMGVSGDHHEVQDSVVLTSRTDLRPSSDDTEESSETVHFDPRKQTDVGLDPDSDESLESTIAKVQRGTSRNSTQKIIDPTASQSQSQLYCQFFNMYTTHQESKFRYSLFVQQ